MTEKSDALVERWFSDHFPNSVVARAGSEVWNLVLGAKDELKRRLAAPDVPETAPRVSPGGESADRFDAGGK